MLLRQKLVIVTVLCSVIPIVLMALLALSVSRHSLRDLVEQELAAVADQELAGARRVLADGSSNLGTWSQLGIMQDVLMNDQDGDVQAELDRLHRRYPDFAELLVVNEYGLVVAASGSTSIGEDLSVSDEVRQVLDGERFQSLVRPNERLGHEVITLAEPIVASYHSSSIIGVIVARLDWRRVKASLASRTLYGGPQSDERRIVLQSIDDGRVLFSTLGFAPPAGLQGRAETLRIGGEDFLLASRHTIMGDAALQPTNTIINDPRWVVHVMLSTRVAYASIWQVRDALVLAGLIILVLAIIAGLWLARTIIKPLEVLILGAEQLADGHNDSPLPFAGRDEVGRLAASFARMRDAVVTKHAELLQRTEVSEEAARLKGEFLANMSHEVRTPINGVLGMTELLLSTELDGSQQRYASTIYRSGQSLLHVINDILDFSKIEAGKLQLDDSAFDLRQLVEDVVELLAETAHRKGLELTINLAPDSHVAFRGDMHRLRQVLTNLISNAVKFTEHGQVSLEVSILPDTVAPERTILHFAVTDTGIGISDAAQAVIFDSFVQADGSTTRQYGGTGLGLAICASLAELMGGEIGVESVPGEGATFWFTADVAVLSSDIETRWQGGDALAGCHVLVVDDNQTNRQIIAGQLDHWGASYESVDGGPAALVALRHAVDLGKPFELMILDMNMPVMDGLQLAELVRSGPALPQLSIALLSSMCDQIDAGCAMRLDIGVTLTKPVRQPDLHNSLIELLDRRSENDGRGAVAKTTGPLPFASPVMSLTSVAPQPSGLVGRVLLAEDHPVNQILMCEMLCLLGLDVTTVDNGQQAIDALVEEQFDVILMDCQMPVLDGFSSTREIRASESMSKSTERQIIIALTANALQGDREACLAAGMDDYLSKPASRTELLRCLSQWLPAHSTCPKNSVDSDISGIDNVVALPDVTDVTFAGDGNQVQAAELSEVLPETELTEVSTTGPLDLVVFGALEEMASQAAPDFLSRLIDTYLNGLYCDLDAIAQAIEMQDLSALGSFAHRLKSSSANFGASRLAATCQTLESTARGGELAPALDLLQLMRCEADEVEQALRSSLVRAA